MIDAYNSGAEKVVKTVNNFPADKIVIYGLSLLNLKNRAWMELQPIMNIQMEACDRLKEIERIHDTTIKPVGELQEIKKIASDYVTKWKDLEEHSSSIGENIRTAYILLGYDHGEELKRAAFAASQDGGDIQTYLEVPSIDLCIRTGGEMRVSSGPMYQMRNSEFIIDNTKYWPDVEVEDFNRWIEEYKKRQRRNGS